MRSVASPMWVTLVLAVAFGIRGANLWNELSFATQETEGLQQDLAAVRKQRDENLMALVEDAKMRISQHAEHFNANVVIEGAKIGLGTDVALTG